MRTSAKSRLIRPGDGDQLGNALHALAQHVVRHAESLLEVGAFVHDLQQTVVGDDDERIGLLFELGDAGFGRLDAARALKGERAGDHADGQCADFLGDLGHDGRAAGAGAAAHSGGDEDHVRAFEDAVHLLGRLFDGLAPGFRVAAGAQPARQLLAHPYARSGLGEHQRLGVGVDCHEINA